MTAVQAMATMGTLALAAVAPVLGTDLGLRAALIGYQVSIVFGGAMVSSLYAGVLIRRYGAVAASQFAMLCCAGGCALAASASLAGMAIGSFVIGLAYGVTNPAASHVLARLAPPTRRNLVFSVKQTGVPIGGMLAGLIGPAVTLALGWQALPLVVAAFAAVIIATLWPLRRLDDDRSPGASMRQNPLNDVARIWRVPALRQLAGAYFLFAVIQMCLVSFAVTLLVEQAAFTLTAAGIVLTVLQVGAAAGRLFWGWLADRIGDGLLVLALTAAISAVMAALTAALSAAWPVAIVCLVMAVFGAAAVGWNGVAIAEVVRRSEPGMIGATTGGVWFFPYAGILVGPAAFSALHGLFDSYRLAFAVLVVVATVGLLLTLKTRAAQGTTG